MVEIVKIVFEIGEKMKTVPIALTYPKEPRPALGSSGEIVI